MTCHQSIYIKISSVPMETDTPTKEKLLNIEEIVHGLKEKVE